MTQLKWRPTIESKDTISIPSSFITAMEEVGYRFPCTLSDEDLPVLRGMASTAVHDTRTAVKELIDLIINHDSIDVDVAPEED